VKNGFLLSAIVSTLALAAGAAAQDADVSWLAQIPGLEAGSRSKAGGATTITHAFRGDPNAVFAQVVQGLLEHKWTVHRRRGLSAQSPEDAEALRRALRATKGLEVLHASILGGPDAYTLELGLVTAATPPPAAAASPAQGAAPTTFRTSGKIEIPGDNATRTVVCRDYDTVSVLGNRSHITLSGACETLEVLGNDNVIDISGGIDQIGTYGRANTVTWSRTANPVPPQIALLGDGNQVNPRQGAASPPLRPARKH
jgi:hypothetical protein